MNTAILMLQEQYENNPLIGAEIGVQDGESAANILYGLNMKKLYLVDIWAPYEEKGEVCDYSADYEKVKEMYKNMGAVEIKRMTSVEAAKEIEDESLDFVYIDACHAYESVKEDIEIWSKKVKKGGVICGDDYVEYWDGVQRAVKEFAKENKLEVFQVITKAYTPADWIIKK